MLKLKKKALEGLDRKKCRHHVTCEERIITTIIIM